MTVSGNDRGTGRDKTGFEACGGYRAHLADQMEGRAGVGITQKGEDFDLAVDQPVHLGAELGDGRFGVRVEGRVGVGGYAPCGGLGLWVVGGGED